MADDFSAAAWVDFSPGYWADIGQPEPDRPDWSWVTLALSAAQRVRLLRLTRPDWFSAKRTGTTRDDPTRGLVEVVPPEQA